MNFFEGAPAFAAEMRSENDYGSRAEREIKEKIADYFAVGTLIVWDVDLLGEDVIRAYATDSPDQPINYRRLIEISGNTFELIFETSEDIAQTLDNFALGFPEAAPVRFQEPPDE